jgi:hypothetical protein
MNPRYAVVLAGNILFLVILIYFFFVLRARYYLVIAVPQKTVVQLGPFEAQYSCENARRGIPDMIAGERLGEKDRGELLKFMACVPLH